MKKPAGANMPEKVLATFAPLAQFHKVSILQQGPEFLIKRSRSLTSRTPNTEVPVSAKQPKPCNSFII